VQEGPAVGAAPQRPHETIGHAANHRPGTKVHESVVPWDDRSGDRLREWLAVDKDTFYDDGCIAIMPIGARMAHHPHPAARE
jgi:uracil-DNA glycosylase